MAFLDDISKKVSQMGQSAVQKTKDFTEVARINGMISDEEKKLNNNFYQIGKLYFEKHHSDYEDDFAGMITAILNSEARIKEYKQQVQDIKGVVRCEKCGAEVATNVAFCSSCGSPMPVQAQPIVTNPNLKKCTGCGAMVDKDMRFCTSCGAVIASEPTPTPAPVAESSDVVTSTPEVEQSADNSVSSYCTNCGAVIEQDAVFCTNCGAKIN